MSYHSWTIEGFGFCVDDIFKDESLNVEKFLNLAAMEPSVFSIVCEYIDDFCKSEGISENEMTIDDFDELEGDYCERGLSYILYNVITEIPIEFADDYNGTQYILYRPGYPWTMTEKDEGLTAEKVEAIFNKYIKILTDTTINIEYYSVENGG